MTHQHFTHTVLFNLQSHEITYNNRPNISKYFPQELKALLQWVPDSSYIMCVDYETDVQIGITGSSHVRETIKQTIRRELCEELKLTFKDGVTLNQFRTLSPPIISSSPSHPYSSFYSTSNQSTAVQSSSILPLPTTPPLLAPPYPPSALINGSPNTVKSFNCILIPVSHLTPVHCNFLYSRRKCQDRADPPQKVGVMVYGSLKELFDILSSNYYNNYKDNDDIKSIAIMHAKGIKKQYCQPAIKSVKPSVQQPVTIDPVN